MATQEIRTLNVSFAAVVSAGVCGGLAVIFTPLVSVLMLFWRAVHAPISDSGITVEHGMLLTVSAPFLSAALGLILGGCMAFLFNMFVKSLLAPRPALGLVAEQESLVATASMTDVA